MHPEDTALNPCLWNTYISQMHGGMKGCHRLQKDRKDDSHLIGADAEINNGIDCGAK